MNSKSSAKVRALAAEEICNRFDLNKEACLLLKSEMGLREFVETLLTNNEFMAAIDFIAHALPAREAVWWGCLCLQHACGSGLSAQEKAACRAAVDWIREPTEGNRAAAKVPADVLGPGSIAGALASAVNTAEGCFALAKALPEGNGVSALANAVAIAVKLTAKKGDPVKIAGTQRLFVGLGIGVMEGRFRWPEIRNGIPARRME